MTKTQLIEDIRHDVPSERLHSAMLLIWDMLVKADMGGGEFLPTELGPPDQMLDKFLKTCSVRQLKLLRGLVLKLEDVPLQ
jgi:hypothetical protein